MADTEHIRESANVLYTLSINNPSYKFTNEQLELIADYKFMNELMNPKELKEYELKLLEPYKLKD
jgi:hypothetical protein